MQEIDFKPSRRLGLLLGTMALLGAVALARADLPAAPRAAALAVVAASVGYAWKRRRPPERLRVMPDGRLQRCGATGEWDDVAVLPESFVSTGLIVLRYRAADGATRSLTLLPDSADGASLRRLRVSLRWARHTRSDTASQDGG